MIIDRPAPKDIPALRQLWKQAFGDGDPFLDGFFATGFSFDRCRCVCTDGSLAAALYWFDCSWQGKKVAYLYAVATDAAFQGKGLCRALMENTHRLLQAEGYAGAALVPGNKRLFSLYEKLGYHSFCPMQTVTVTAGEGTAKVNTLSGAAFETLRKERLPENGILQRGQTTAFLATFAGFYQAGDAIFCAGKDQDTLVFQEYLGDPSQLRGIIAAFRAEKGIVRLPGGENSAMYLPLNEDPTLPGYLGIPLN